MARVSEVNRLSWDDVNLERRYLVLYTRKKRGGHLTPRKVPLTQRLHEILGRRFSVRDEAVPWVFWRFNVDQQTGERKPAPYNDRRELIKNLCNKAGVRHFRFHALRHAGASIMDNQRMYPSGLFSVSWVMKTALPPRFISTQSARLNVRPYLFMRGRFKKVSHKSHISPT